MASDLEDAGVIADIVDLAASRRVPVQEVARRRLEAAARSEAPQGVLAKAAAAGRGRPRRPDGAAGAQPAAVPGRRRRRHRPGQPRGPAALGRRGRGERCRAAAAPGRARHADGRQGRRWGDRAPRRSPSCPGLPATLQTLAAQRIWVVGLDDAADRTPLRAGRPGHRADRRSCSVPRAPGCSRLARERCDVVVSIPMLGRLSSLNVSAAAALACYEVARHRLAAP